MRVSSRFALFAVMMMVVSSVAAPAADEPAPLLKPITPTGTQSRIRFPLIGGFPQTMRFKAQTPNGKKKSEIMDIEVALDTLPGRSYISTKTLEKWGYEVPKGKEFILPELLISATQVAPKPTKSGRDVVFKLANVKLQVVESPANTEGKIYSCDFSISATELYKGGEKTLEPRVAFIDHFIEVTVSPAALKRLPTDDMKTPEVTTDATANLVTAAAPTVMRSGAPFFAYAAVNGQENYKLANGTVVPVNAGVSSISNWETGIVVTIGLARGCKVDVDYTAKAGMATGVDANSEMLPGKVKELRLGLYTGTGLKVQKDLVLKDVPVMVDKNMSEGYVWIGPKFIETYFKDGVYANSSEGVWKLHGRCNPDLLFDIKTRKKDAKEPPK
jgi:hypothetical protein